MQPRQKVATYKILYGNAGLSTPRPSISLSSSLCAATPLTAWAAAIPEPATAGTPMPGKVESPQSSSPSTFEYADGVLLALSTA